MTSIFSNEAPLLPIGAVIFLIALGFVIASFAGFSLPVITFLSWVVVLLGFVALIVAFIAWIASHF